MSMPLKPSKAEAQRFLDLLEPGGMFTFQILDDDKDRNRQHLKKVLHGDLERHFDNLVHYNEQGAGIFVVINQTDFKGRKASNVLKVRACFVDLDGAPLEPVLNHQLEPTTVVESSKGRWHAYFPCSDMPLEAFTPMQHAIADAFDGDHACCDLPRVMRLPGFFHQKVQRGIRSEPFMTRIESAHDDLSYTYAELQEAFPTPEKPAVEQTDSDFDTDGKADLEALREALAHIDPEPRENWIKIGHAMKSTDPNLLALYLEFSRGDLTGRKPHNYIDDADVIAAWNSFAPNRIGIGAVFAMAKANGYVPTRRNTGLRLGTQIEVAALLCNEIGAETSAPLVHSEGTFWGYSSTHWEEIPESALRKRAHKLDGTHYGKNSILRISRSFIDGVIREMAAMADSPNFFEASERGVNLRNGFVKISACGKISLEPHSAEHRQRFLISQEWLPDVCEVPDGLLQTLLFGSFGKDDVESHRLILEIMGAAISGINTGLSNPKAFVFHGPSAANGKSTIQAAMRHLLPRHVVACIAPADLGEPQFLATLAGCQVNLSDEISSAKAIATDRFKATVTGDPVQAKAIYKVPFTFTPRALHVFSANHLPSFSGGVDNGIVRRIVVVPFNRSIPEAERIPDLAAKIVEQEGYVLVSLALQAAADVVARGGFTIPSKCEAATVQWFKDVDPVAEWFEDGALERHVHTAGVLVRDLY
ncbi:MAG: DNA-primase RepB domain-containing protein, partial [Proteobacteria bacterium]|nr:DNA-primase RepB domain-containing protein [Pseudomonadota bacterium]